MNWDSGFSGLLDLGSLGASWFAANTPLFGGVLAENQRLCELRIGPQDQFAHAHHTTRPHTHTARSVATTTTTTAAAASHHLPPSNVAILQTNTLPQPWLVKVCDFVILVRRERPMAPWIYPIIQSKRTQELNCRLLLPHCAFICCLPCLHPKRAQYLKRYSQQYEFPSGR